MRRKRKIRKLVVAEVGYEEKWKRKRRRKMRRKMRRMRKLLMVEVVNRARGGDG